MKMAVEIQGGVRGKSRHFSAEGFAKDAEKFVTAAIMGWIVVPINYHMIQKGLAGDLICLAYEATTERP
jgi:hypothetical protein